MIVPASVTATPTGVSNCPSVLPGEPKLPRYSKVDADAEPDPSTSVRSETTRMRCRAGIARSSTFSAERSSRRDPSIAEWRHSSDQASVCSAWLQQEVGAWPVLDVGDEGSRELLRGSSWLAISECRILHHTRLCRRARIL